MSFGKNQFIIGKFGGKEICREELGNFFKIARDMEWTTNSIYKAATPIKVEPTFSTKTKEENILSKYQKNVNYTLQETTKHEDFMEYTKSIEDKRTNDLNKIKNNKAEMNSKYFNNEASLNKDDMVNRLQNNWKSVLLNSDFSKFGMYRGFLMSGSNQYN